MKYQKCLISSIACLVALQLTACGSDDSTEQEPLAAEPVIVEPVARACDAIPEILMTADGTEFVRTPDDCFNSLPDWSYDAKYVEIDGLRQAYVDEGPKDAPVFLLLHGQPAWSYLYRKMIPVLVESGYRVIAMDHLGMGRSDKPIDIDDYSYLAHNDRLERFIQALELQDINLFVQDWGSLIGLRVAGLNPEWFARIAVGNGALPMMESPPYPDVENPNETLDLTSPYALMPDQQFPFYNGCELIFPRTENAFFDWMEYAMKGESYNPSETVEALTWFALPDSEEAAYSAPFPERTYMAGTRKFPSLINEVAGTTELAWAGLNSFERPLITIWASNDTGDLGSCEAQQILIDNVPGAAGQMHVRLPEASHFLQDDQGEEIARRLVDFMLFDAQNQGDRWIMTAIEELHSLEAINDEDLARSYNYLRSLLATPTERLNEEAKANVILASQSQDAIEIIERAYKRVSSPLNYHQGYWVSEQLIEGIPSPVTAVNDIHVDAYEGTITVYGQVQVMGQIIAPVQAGLGEEVQHFSTNMLGMHPNAVYLNGSGEELTESDGTGSWWVKHPIVGPEGYYNWPMLIEDYSNGGQYTEGEVLEDGVTLAMRSFFEDSIRGFPVDNNAITNEFYGNTRTPGFSTDPVTHISVRYEPANVDPDAGIVDYTSTLMETVVFECREEASALDGLVRDCPDLDYLNY